MQEGHPVPYKSKKFSDIEIRWPMHKNEMLVIVYALRQWRHYVQDKLTKIFTDNISLQYFQRQPKLSSKQACWPDFLTEFDIVIIHKK